MALVLQFDGVGNYVTFSDVSVGSSDDFTLRLVQRKTNTTTSVNGAALIGNSTNFSTYVGVGVGNLSTVRLRLGSFTNLNFTLLTPVVIDELYDWEITRTSGVVDIKDTQTGLSIVTGTVVNNSSFSINQYARFGTTTTLGGFGVNLIQLTSPTGNVRHSADDSDHGNTGLQPKLLDTISGNDATGVNFPTDGSAWIDLGGGVTDLEFSDVSTKPTLDSSVIQIITALAISDITVQPELDSADITVITQLSIDGISVNPTIDNLTIESINNLLFYGVSVGPTLDSLTIESVNDLLLSGIETKPTVDGLVITNITPLIFSGIEAQPTLDLLTIEPQGELSFSGITTKPTLDSIDIKLVTKLIFSDITTRPAVDLLTLDSVVNLQLSSITTQPTLDSTSIENYTNLSFSGISVQPTLDLFSIPIAKMPDFGNNDIKLTDNTVRYSLTDNSTKYRIT